jgi:tetratricopeptide (TPR) repeat protein
MKPNYYLATLALVAGGMAVGIYLVPRGGELATMYYRSGRLDEARRILESEMRDGELSATNVHYATQTYLRLGDVDRAIELIDRYSRANGTDVKALRILTNLYRDAGKVSLYRISLERLERIAPATEQRIELARVYRAAGLYDEWFAMLERLVQQNVAPAEDYMTVAMLKAAKGDRDGALKVLALLVERHPKSVRIAADELRVNLELDSGRPEKALAAAQDCIRRIPEVSTALSFAELFVRRDRPALALTLLDPFADRARDNVDFTRTLISLELSQGRAASALARLEALDAAGKLSPADRNFLVAATLAVGKWDAAKLAFQRIEFADLWQNSIELMAREAISRNDHAVLKAIADRSTPEFRDAFPITSAEIAFVLGDRVGAKRLADEANRREALSGGERIALAMVYARLEEPEQAKRLLAALTDQAAVPDYLAIELAALYIKLGLAADGFAYFDKAAKADESLRLRAARSLLDAKIRPDARDWDLAWTGPLPGEPDRLPAPLMTAVYFTAMDNEIYPYAAELARRLLGDAPTTELKLRYARALALSGDADGALAIVQPLLAQSADARSIHGVALIAAVKAGRMRAEDVRAFIARQLADEAVPQSEKATLIYDLLSIKAYDIVLPPLEALVRGGRREFVELYAAALTGVKDKKQLRALLEREIRETKERAKLETLAKVAFEEGLFDLARPAYQRILKDDAKNVDALKRLGQMAMWRNEPDAATARRYFEAFVANGGDDYQIDFMLGEVIIQFPDWQRATPHYQRALAKLGKLEKPSLDDGRLRAKCLYRLGRFDDSIAAYDALMRQYPRDRALRDEFYDVLVDMGRYDRARALRGGLRDDPLRVGTPERR